MQARLLEDNDGLKLLLSNGFIMIPQKTDIRALLFNFKLINKGVEDGNFQECEKWDSGYPEMSSYPGETVAYVTDALHLVIVNFKPFHSLFETSNTVNSTLDNLLTVAEYARLYNKSMEQIKVFCRTGRIPEAKKIGRDWVIPSDAPYPVDNRVSYGKYIINK